MVMVTQLRVEAPTSMLCVHYAPDHAKNQQNGQAYPFGGALDPDPIIPTAPDIGLPSDHSLGHTHSLGHSLHLMLGYTAYSVFLTRRSAALHSFSILHSPQLLSAKLLTHPSFCNNLVDS